MWETAAGSKVMACAVCDKKLTALMNMLVRLGAAKVIEEGVDENEQSGH